jgi:predicted AAA+ superfamily ATPase
MMPLHQLEEIVSDQKAAFLAKGTGVPRDVDFEPFLKTPQVVAITGVRRCGKSTLLRQIADRLDSFYYLNFDDERLFEFNVSDFQELMVAFQKKGGSRHVLLDEVQNVPGWERFVRRLHDEQYKVFLTGSNARLLSSELATHLTGRDRLVPLYPFSFGEYLKLAKAPSTVQTTAERARVLKHLDEYLIVGGFPERLLQNDPETVQRVYEGILYRDIVVRFRVRETKALKTLAHYLFSNFTTQVSYQGLHKILPFKSAMTVRSHIGHMQDAWLLFELHRYDSSLKRQHIHNKKVYVIDNGMRHSVAFSTSEDRGKYLENMVFLELRRRGKDVFYYQGSRECDFIVRTGTRVTDVIQCCFQLEPANEAREVGGLAEAMQAFRLKDGLILTLNQESVRKVGGYRVRVQPVWKWLLS